ncbi:MAG: GTPase Era [Oscillospiraceae bacterium]|nr:GTPase Era [Oscillospiraceae bacterium]
MSEKTVFTAITGRPNAGKSSLLNLLVREKIAIVSDKPQTTRTRITGILTEGEMQYVFIDTPGIHKSRNKLSSHMNKAVREAVSGIDAVVYMIDCTRGIHDIDRQTLDSYSKKEIPVILVINKIDLLEDKASLAPLLSELSEVCSFFSVIPMSVKKKDGADILLKDIAAFAKDEPHYFPDDKVTSQPEKAIMAEMIREKLLMLLHDEIPHGIAVVIESLEEKVSRSGEDILDIAAVIYCERESHKGIVIGKGGEMLRRVGELARRDLESFFRIKVNLKTWVKVRDGWRNDENRIADMGLSDS